ncbi:MAG: sigma-70 family RNA polymerase sigma factor [Opitutus sp.]
METVDLRDRISAGLLERRAQVKAFLVSRLGNEADAEDVLQNGLIKALARADELRDETKLVAWFYQVLRHAVIDHVRSRMSAVELDRRWTEEMAALEPEDQREICRCFESLIDQLKPRNAALLRRVEMEGQSVSAAAASLGISANNASVGLHRARAELRGKLEELCGQCAVTECLDCNCPPTS